MIKLIKRLLHIHKWRYSYYNMQRHCPKCDDREYRIFFGDGSKSEWLDAYLGGKRMSGTRKVFSQMLHDKYDGFGRQIVKKYLRGRGIIAINNPDIYGVDLILLRGCRRIGYGEVEVRSSWRGYKFPFSDLNIPDKEHLFRQDLPVYFFSVNNEGTAMFICNAKRILAKDKVLLSNKYKENEPFYKMEIPELEYKIL